MDNKTEYRDLNMTPSDTRARGIGLTIPSRLHSSRLHY